MSTPTPANPERIVLAVVAKLETIRVSGGSFTDVERVYRVPLNIDQPPTGAFAVLTLIAGALRLRATGTTRGLYKAVLEMTIGGMISVGQGDPDNPEHTTALNLLVSDVIEALNDDPRFGIGQHVDSVMGDVELLSDPDRGMGVFGMPFQFTFYVAKGTLR